MNQTMKPEKRISNLVNAVALLYVIAGVFAAVLILNGLQRDEGSPLPINAKEAWLGNAEPICFEYTNITTRYDPVNEWIIRGTPENPIDEINKQCDAEAVRHNDYDCDVVDNRVICTMENQALIHRIAYDDCIIAKQNALRQMFPATSHTESVCVKEILAQVKQ